MSRRRILTKTCRRCGTDYHPTRTVQAYCTPACRWEAERERNAARLTKQCPTCGKDFLALGGTRWARRFCSAGCGVRAYHAGQRAQRERACRGCGVTFSPPPSATSRGSGLYCSRACYYRVIHERPAMIEVSCTNCQGTFRRTRAAIARTKHAFCSRACGWAWLSGPNSHVWRGGEAHWRGRTWTVALREQIRERDGRRCRMCGKAESDNGPRRLDVDHVIPFRWFDGDYEQANQTGNLVALCTVCHRRKARAERKFLQGDVLEMNRYREAVALPWPDVPQLDLGLIEVNQGRAA